MRPPTSYPEARGALRDATGIVIPIYFPRGCDAALARSLLRDTAGAFVGEVARPAALCLSADGPGPGEEAARALGRQLGAQVVAAPRNCGKLRAVRAGMRRLLQQPGLRYFAVLDQDGDHFANELVNFVRAAQHVERSVAGEALVIGRRISRHRPLGFLRGELEELADRMLLDALHYHAAVSGRPLRLEFAATLDEFPDFHSGYKLFSRGAAEAVFAAPPRRAGVSEACYYRHAVEAVMSLEAAVAGACLAQVNRSTLDEQPFSVFGLMDRRRMTADKIIWPCKRLRVPGKFVAQWLRHHLPRLLLGSLAPQGKDELLGVQRRVLEAFDLRPSAQDIVRPRFV